MPSPTPVADHGNRPDHYNDDADANVETHYGQENGIGRWTATRSIVGRASGPGLMATAAKVSRLDAKLDALAAAIDTDSRAITVVVFQGETREFARQRHRELRPDHAGRPVRFEYRNKERDDVREMFAVRTPEELQVVLDRIEVKGRGKPIGEQVLADAHWRDAENDRLNHRD